jgi:hypothetical protein
MFAVAALLSSFAVPQLIKLSIVVTLIVSSYAFCVALPLGATVGHRGLSSERPMVAKVVYLGNVVGAVASLAAGFILVYASFVSL